MFVNTNHSFPVALRKERVHMLEKSDDSVIMARVTKVVVEVLKVKPDIITPDSKYKEDFGADSLDTVSLLMELEDEFKTTVSDEEAAGLVTVGATVDFIKSKAMELSSS